VDKRTSLGKIDADGAEQLVLAKNQAERQPNLNRKIAQGYLAGADSGINTRTCRQAYDSFRASAQVGVRVLHECVGACLALERNFGLTRGLVSRILRA
jgi:hypothetical protein